MGSGTIHLNRLCCTECKSTGGVVWTEGRSRFLKTRLLHALSEEFFFVDSGTNGDPKIFCKSCEALAVEC